MLIIGENLNSTRAIVRKMVEDRDAESVHELARRQVEKGANMLDVNASAAMGNREDNLKWLVRTVQEAVKIPLCIDSPDAEEIEKSLELYNWSSGKALINSITGEQEKITRLLPIIKKYGCAVIALAMDERGIPDNAQVRIEIAHKLINILTDSGVSLVDIYIDPLVVPIGTDDKNGIIVLDTLRGIKESYPEVKTVIGLSNISFGLPGRKLINQVFMLLTMASGIDAAIIDPADKRLMAFIKVATTLLGEDPFCTKYIEAFRDGKMSL